MRYQQLSHRLVAIAIFSIAAVVLASVAWACPYCTVESQTLTEEIDAADVAVIAYLVKGVAPQPVEPDALGEFGMVDPETGKAKFRITRVIKGEETLVGMEEFEAVFFGDPDYETPFFLRGFGEEEVDWTIPIALTPLGMQYVDDLDTLPESGPDRLAYFLRFLQHDDPLLSQDAYDEFAKSPYADVIALAPRMDKPKLWEWIESREVSPSRRSLYFTMLGVCGDSTDADRLEEMMLSDSRVLRSAAEASAAAVLGLGGPITIPVVPEMVAMEQRRKQLGFNALVGCYLKLRGPGGLDVVDEHFLANDDADYTQVYAACLALRFLGEETEEVPMDRLCQSMRLVLDKEEFAEQAITDLARWEDWSVLDRLVAMFENAPERTYVKEPIVAYLDQASQQEGEVGERAEAALTKLEELDPESVKRARSLLAFGFLGRARGSTKIPDPGAEEDALASSSSGAPSLVDDTDEDATPAELPLADAIPDPTHDKLANTIEPAENGEDSTIEAVEETVPVEVDMTSLDAPADLPATDSPVVASETSDATDGAVKYNRVWGLTLPLVALVGFMGLVWLILRGGV